MWLPVAQICGQGGRRFAALPRGFYPARTTATGQLPRTAAATQAATAVEAADRELLDACGIRDRDELAPRCMAARTALGQPTGRWTPQCLALAIRMAVVNRGWPAPRVVSALLAVAGDRQTRSPVRLAEADPWWDAGTSDDPPVRTANWRSSMAGSPSSAAADPPCRLKPEPSWLATVCPSHATP